MRPIQRSSFRNHAEDAHTRAERARDAVERRAHEDEAQRWSELADYEEKVFLINLRDERGRR